MKHSALIVTAPMALIALAQHDALGRLLSGRGRGLIPDMVRFELAGLYGQPLVEDVLQWIRAHEPDPVFCPTTEIFDEFAIVLAAKPKTKTVGRGEQAAAEVLNRELDRGIEAVTLIFEDGMVKPETFLANFPPNVQALSVSGFLKAASLSA